MLSQTQGKSRIQQSAEIITLQAQWPDVASNHGIFKGLLLTLCFKFQPVSMGIAPCHLACLSTKHRAHSRKNVPSSTWGKTKPRKVDITKRNITYSTHNSMLDIYTKYFPLPWCFHCPGSLRLAASTKKRRLKKSAALLKATVWESSSNMCTRSRPFRSHTAQETAILESLLPPKWKSQQPFKYR